MITVVIVSMKLKVSKKFRLIFSNVGRNGESREAIRLNKVPVDH